MADLTDAPYTTHPTGWFMVGWSWDLKPGDVTAMRIFDTEVVMYRTESGQACVADAYCPHLGAHVGHGGKVIGENIQCPWHGWEYGKDGVNCKIAFSDRVRKDAVLRQWHTSEKDGIIHVWYDALGRDPLWEWPGVPAFSDADNFYLPNEHPFGATAYGILDVTPYIYIENAADAMHFPFVHGASEPVSIDKWEETDHHYLKVQFGLTFGAGKQSTRMTPDGPARGLIDNDVYGLGLGLVTLEIGNVSVFQLVSLTPVDSERSYLWSTIGATRDPSSPDSPPKVTELLMNVQVEQLVNDFTIWKYLRYNNRPKFVGREEALYPRLRRWRDRFYPVDFPQRAGIASSAVSEAASQ